ncbi:MAG TPA: multiheme c-type cytochrome [Candidatus Limnocylindria bacterium]|nr:multiheme c-type cytochrome [Candidatus Limnocylindria bacterium]
MAAATWATLTAASAPSVKQADKLIILSTTDVKGKTSPCGCSTPKGGLARRASFIDSMRADYGRIVVVDAGGYFPEQDTHRDVAAFMMDAMKLLNLDALGVGERDLRFGLAYLRQEVARTQAPVVSANLYDKGGRKPIFPPYRITSVGGVKVGFFSLISPKVPLGPAQDSLSVIAPEVAARKVVAELRRKGVNAVVLLTQLGKVESEDLSAAVDGIDALVIGHNVPVLPKGRMIKSTVAVYGGEQGQYMGRTLLNLDAKGKVLGGDAETYMLGPSIPEHPEVLKLVKSFEDGFNEKMRAAEKARSEQIQKEKGEDQFLGADLCTRCHVDEAEQWKTTSHSIAWQTLIDVKKDATPDCIPCHVVGYKQAGGFQSSSDVPRLANVQCENCHGMGTQHDAFAHGSQGVTEQACIKCHQGENDPNFVFAAYLPKIAHSNLSGETIKNKKTPTPDMMRGHGSH